MNVIGLIAEYNPFHNGHKYMLNQIKKKYPDSIIICILNGYFTERGNISILSKEDKTKIALSNNIDIVLELPFIYGTQSADIFAYNSIKILNEYKIDTLIFGSESNNVNTLNKIVDLQSNNNYDELVENYLDQGFNYPTSLAKALNIEFDFKPNDLLGISYIKAIRKINPNIKVETIKRTNEYHDIELDSSIVSASNIRERLRNKEDISKYLPEEVLKKINNISNDDVYNLLKFKILTDKDLSVYLDVDEGLENRIMKYINESKSIDELISNIKTKRYTYNKINRMLVHILIGLTKKDNQRLQLEYTKILGFTPKGQEYLKTIKKELTLPTTPPKDSLIFAYELKAAYIYEQTLKKSLNDFDKKNIPIK